MKNKTIKSFECKSCGIVFQSKEDFIQHEKYARYRRESCCWQ